MAIFIHFSIYLLKIQTWGPTYPAWPPQTNLPAIYRLSTSLSLHVFCFPFYSFSFLLFSLQIYEPIIMIKYIFFFFMMNFKLVIVGSKQTMLLWDLLNLNLSNQFKSFFFLFMEKIRNAVQWRGVFVVLETLVISKTINLPKSFQFCHFIVTFVFPFFYVTLINLFSPILHIICLN